MIWSLQDVVVETETQTIKEELDDLEKQRKETQEINENSCRLDKRSIGGGAEAV